jgi:hypothetical protein
VEEGREGEREGGREGDKQRGSRVYGLCCGGMQGESSVLGRVKGLDTESLGFRVYVVEGSMQTGRGLGTCYVRV